jgi:cell wall-associated NlpC family hydrolase
MSALSQPHHNRRTIAVSFKSVVTMVFCAGTCSWAQVHQPARAPAASHAKLPRPAALTKQDGLSIVSVARDSHLRRGSGNDCSHLVHTIYQRAGFSYPYADSSDLYRGTPDFLRVKHPQPGDLVVWPGHVGIVVSPAHRTFFSALSHGPGTDQYDARYWKRRGPARFYRYIDHQPSQTAFRAD